MAPFGASRAGLMSVTRDDIPDSGLLRDFDASSINATDNDSIDSWDDSQSETTLTGSGIYRDDGINGEPAVEFDGVDDYFNGDGIDQNQPWVVFVVINQSSTGDRQNILDGTGFSLSTREDVGSGPQLFAGEVLRFSDDATYNSDIIRVGVADGSNSEVRENGDSLIVGDAGGQSTGSFGISSSDHPFEGEISRVLLYDLDELESDSSIQEVESHLGEKYGITI